MSPPTTLDRRRGGVSTAVLALLSALAMTLTLAAPSALPAHADEHDGDDPTSVEVERFAGEDRFETAAEIATATFDTAETVFVARADLYPDALAANFAAGHLDAPILLLPNDELNDHTMDALEELETDAVRIVGGRDAISAEVAQELVDAGYSVSRLHGEDRFETAYEVGDAFAPVPHDGENVAIVASGEDFPDALLAGAIAYAQGFPLLLTDRDELNPHAEAGLADWEIDRVIIPGGEQAVSAEVADAIEDEGIDVTRVAGERRTTTATELADFARSEFGWGAAQVNLARGDLFPDALTIGPHAGAAESVLLLTWDPDTLERDDDTAGDERGAAQWLRDEGCEIVALHLAGGVAAITGQTEHDARDAAEHCEATIEGTVLDVSDAPRSTAPIENVTVTVTDADGTVATTTTDADGEYTVEVVLGTYDVTADHDDHTSATQEDVTVGVDGEEGVDFGLYPLVDVPDDFDDSTTDADDVAVVADGDFWRVPLVVDGVELHVTEDTDDEDIRYERPGAETIRLGSADTDASYWTRGEDCTSGFAEGDHRLYYNVEHDTVDDGWYVLEITFDVDGCLVAVNGASYDDPS